MFNLNSKVCIFSLYFYRNNGVTSNDHKIRLHSGAVALLLFFKILSIEKSIEKEVDMSDN